MASDLVALLSKRILYLCFFVGPCGSQPSRQFNRRNNSNVSWRSDHTPPCEIVHRWQYQPALNPVHPPKKSQLAPLEVKSVRAALLGRCGSHQRWWLRAFGLSEGVGFFGVDGEVPERTNFSHQTDCVLDLHSLLYERMVSW